jgi:hypothetical protein
MDTPARKSDPPNYYKMPPVGLTETRARIGLRVMSQYTVRCGSINCWFVGHGGNREDALLLLDQHACPTPPARNELPTGRSTLEKMWDELDDVTKMIIEKGDYNGMQGESLKGYALGCAFALSMMTHPYFKTIKDISKELGARYKMGKGLMEWRPTPSYNYNPMPEPFTANIVSTTPAEKRAPTKKATAPRKAPAKVDLAPEIVTAIKAAGAMGMFSPAELAKMYNATEAQVKEIMG